MALRASRQHPWRSFTVCLVAATSLGLLAAPMQIVPAVGAIGSAARLQFVKRVSGESPFRQSGCAGGALALDDAAVEPHLAVNPSDPDHLVGTWQQDRMARGGGARAAFVAVSRDGGGTWSQPGGVPGTSQCSGGENTYERVTDPWVGVGADGTTYLATLGFHDDPPSDGLNWPAAQQVSVSHDGGTTWPNPPVKLDVDTLLLEKETIAVHPTCPGHAYLTWDLESRDPFGAVPLDTQMRFSRTDDGGATWTDPVTVAPLGTHVSGVMEFPIELQVLPGEGCGATLVLVYATPSQAGRSLDTGPFTLAAVHSSDAGGSWSAPTTIAVVPQTVPSGDNVKLEPIRNLTWLASTARGPDGAVYVAWAAYTAPEAGVDPATDIFVARSTDGGVTWESERALHRLHQALYPTVEVAGDGTVGLLYYDTGSTMAGEELLTEVRLAYARAWGEDWRELRVAGPFDLRKAPRSGGYMVGDYHGLVGINKGFGALFGMAPGIGGAEGTATIWFARIRTS